jgi:hypothetical protein
MTSSCIIAAVCDSNYKSLSRGSNQDFLSRHGNWNAVEDEKEKSWSFGRIFDDFSSVSCFCQVLCTPCYNGLRVVRWKGVNKLPLVSRFPLKQPVVADQGTRKLNLNVYYCVQKRSPLDPSVGHAVQSVLFQPVSLLPITKQHSHLHVNSLHKGPYCC